MAFLILFHIKQRYTSRVSVKKYQVSIVTTYPKYSNNMPRYKLNVLNELYFNINIIYKQTRHCVRTKTDASHGSEKVTVKNIFMICNHNIFSFVKST